jgi:glycosyltransferase involved in cell wall biosynthesis
MDTATRITVIARADLTGLGIQSRNWVRLLRPDKVVIINSEPFNHNKQYPWIYNEYNTMTINGFIQNDQMDEILDNTDVLLTFEIPYNYNLFARAKERGVKTILQNNWEFTDYLQQPLLPLPDLLVNHSYWNLDKQKKLWPDITDYCPTPVFIDDFDDVYRQNISREGGVRRFLHIAGRNTYEDRNGTKDLLEAVKLIPEEYKFELVIKTQTAEIPTITDSRVIIDRDSPEDEKELYRDFDAMILPRRYDGACLPMNEALASGLPVIMTDIDPNNKVLPGAWLVSANRVGSFMARTEIDVYSADHQELAEKIMRFCVAGEDVILTYKEIARDIAVAQYSSELVRNKWDSFLTKLGF